MSDLPFRVTRIAGNSPGPHLLITGAVHGDEFEPIVAIRRLGEWLQEREISGTVSLIAIVNEPAFLRGDRTGEDGLDLARTFPGRADRSATERIAHALTPLIQSADLFIDLHTGGTRLSVYPLAGYTLHRDSTILDKQRRMARAFNLPVVWGTDPTLEGRSLSVARDAGVPAIYAEYLGAASCSENGVEAYVVGCQNVMADFGMIFERPVTPRVEIVVEDDRPGAGHMQVQNPAPVTGLFEPAVNLGDRVAKGELLGSVTGMQGERHDLSAEYDGMVIVLRTFPRVMEGESCGVVMNTNYVT